MPIRRSSRAAALNVVFDLGGVVFNWQPEGIIRRHFRDARTQDVVRAGIFEHPDWLELDRGTLALDEAVMRGVQRTGLPRERVERLFDAVPASLTPKEDTIELIRSISGTGNRLYVISNMHLASIEFLEKNHDIWDCFDGTVISCRVHRIKPEIEIYEHLLSEHRLNASETVFIDDVSENLAAASSIGIRTIPFVDAAQCRSELAKLDVV